MGRLNLLTACIALVSVCCSGPASNAPTVTTPRMLVSANVATSPPVISNVTVKSPNRYAAHTGGMTVGDSVYTDRKYKTISIPTVVANASWIQTADDDKNRDLKDTAYLSFTVTVPVVVYVGHDIRATPPAWLRNQYTNTGLIINNTDQYPHQQLAVYVRHFLAGKVTLGSNNDKSQNCDMYMVMVQPDSVATSVAPVAKAVVTPTPDTLLVGTTKQLTATLFDSTGAPTTDSVAWTVSAPSVATVNPTGLVTAVKTGDDSVVVTASDSVRGVALVHVIPLPAKTLVVVPAAAADTVGQQTQFTDTLKDSTGHVVAGSVTWASTNSSIASIRTTGLLTALTAGVDTVTATFGTLKSSAVVTVTAGGGGGTGTHAGWYVAPNGSSGGAGTLASPWALTTAFSGAGGKIHPGDTVWLRGGTYGSGGYNQYTSTLTGTASAPIIVRQYPGERATINGFMTVNGGYTTFWGMEIMDSDPQRTSTQSGSFPTDIPRANYQVTVNGPGTKFINVVVHDLGNGLAAWESATNAEVYGSLFYNNGWQGTDRGHGHGLYIQNLSGTKLLGDNIVFDNFDYGIQIYSQETHINNITLDGNIAFNNSTLGDEEDQDIVAGGTQNGMQNLVATNNATYRNDRAKTAKFGLDYGVASSNGKISGNYFAGMVQLQNWSSLSFTNNTLYGGAPQALSIELMSGQSFTAYLLNNQQYFEPPSLNIAQPFGTVTATDGGEGHTFADWKSATGLDGSSSFSATDPTGQQIILRPNKYEAGRANIAVYNWSGSGVATVDLSNVLKPGDQFEVRNAQDFYGIPAYSGTYGGGAVSIPLTRVAPVAVIGGSPSAPPVPAPYFYAFVVVKTN